LVAGIAVVVSLLAVNYVFPRTFSFVRLWIQEARESADESVPPEKEIARLKMELNQLAKEDERHFHKVAVQTVEVKNLQGQVEKLRKDLDAREERILTMKVSLKGEDKLVTYKGEKFRRDELTNELRLAAGTFRVDEELLKAKEEQLSLRKNNLENNRKKLSELKLVRQQMKTELERLENALAQERQAQAQENNTLDDASYQKLRKEMDSVRDRIEILKTKRALKGEVESPIRAAEQRKEQDAAIDRYLETRFGDKQ
jgi:chromosome segregation ATPase